MTNHLTILAKSTDAPSTADAPTINARKNWHLLLAHGAGAPMTSPFLENFCAQLAKQGISSTRFEFSYMAARRTGGSRRPPPKAEKLIPEFLEAIKSSKSDLPRQTKIAIGGKSMGGRVASMIAQHSFKAKQIKGLICLGYPFHPPKKPQNLRTAHLMGLTCPTLFIQGERDALGSAQEVKTMRIPDTIHIHWSRDGDHDLKPRVRSGHTHEGNIQDAASAVARFLQHLR